MRSIALALVLAGCWTGAAPEPGEPVEEPAAAPVRAVVAPKVEPFATLSIGFAPASATIDRLSYRDLDMLVRRLARDEPDERFLIVAYDTNLASDRAAAIKNYLVGKGIADTRLRIAARQVSRAIDIRIELVLDIDET